MVSLPERMFACCTAARSVQTPPAVWHSPSARFPSTVSAVLVTV